MSFQQLHYERKNPISGGRQTKSKKLLFIGCLFFSLSSNSFEKCHNEKHSKNYSKKSSQVDKKNCQKYGQNKCSKDCQKRSIKKIIVQKNYSKNHQENPGPNVYQKSSKNHIRNGLCFRARHQFCFQQASLAPQFMIRQKLYCCKQCLHWF